MDNFYDRYFSGHVKLGPIIIYGENAMHWAVNIRTERWGYVCFRLPFRCFGRRWPLYFYVSPDATPSSSTFYLGPDKGERRAAKQRRRLSGHNFNSELLETLEVDRVCDTCNYYSEKGDHGGETSGKCFLRGHKEEIILAQAVKGSDSCPFWKLVVVYSEYDAAADPRRFTEEEVMELIAAEKRSKKVDRGEEIE